MANEQKKKKPVFHQAEPISKEEFIPHQFEQELDEVEPITESFEESEHDKEIIENEIPEVKEETVNEEKIPESLYGWKVITTEQQTGKTYWVTHTLDQEESGTQAFWRKTRSLNHNKWVLHGKWSDALTRSDIIPDPIYYKEV